MTAMNFTHLATGIPTNCAMTWVQVIKYRLGFKNHVIDEVMTRYDLDEYEYEYVGVTRSTQHDEN